MVVLPDRTSSICSTAAPQAWAILRRHARDEISRLRLQELCRDNDRVSSLVSVYNATTPSANSMLMIDLSRQRMTLETLNHLLYLGTARGLPKFIRQLSWGQNDPEHPIVPSRLLKEQDDPNADRDRDRSTPNAANRGNRHNRFGRRDREADKNKNKQQNELPICSIPSYHMALRVPSGRNFEMLARDGSNVLDGIHNDWKRIRRISESLRRGKLPGVTGGMIKDVVVVGRGLAVMALRFVYLALCKDEAATIGRRVGMDGRNPKKGSELGYRRLKFLTTVDPVQAAAVVANLDPSSTLVISVAVAGEDETELAMTATRTLQTWLLTNLGGHGRRPDVILNKHCMLVTSNEGLASQHKPESVFLVPDHSRCEAFTTFTAASLLPLCIVFGWPTVEAFLSGAHDMDQHFVETNPRHNLPVLLALTDVWNDCLLSPSNSNKSNPYSNNAGRILTPYTEALVAYPAFVAALEAQTCGRSRCNRNNNAANPASRGASFLFQNSVISPSSAPVQSSSCSSIVIDGGLHGVYDRSLHRSSKIIPSELVMTLDCQLATNGSFRGGGGTQEIYQAQDALICSLFAHADGLAFGSDGDNDGDNDDPPFANSDDHGPIDSNGNFGGGGGGGAAVDRNNTSFDEQMGHASNGNRPSTLLLCGRLDAFTCGQLVAMAEHRAVVKAWIWDIDPFPLLDCGGSGSGSGATVRSKRTDLLRERLEKMMSDGYSEEEEDDGDEGEPTTPMNLSTKTILRHYASVVKGQRKNVANN